MEIPTKRVLLPDGREATINASDFDSDQHREIRGEPHRWPREGDIVTFEGDPQTYVATGLVKSASKDPPPATASVNPPQKSKATGRSKKGR